VTKQWLKFVPCTWASSREGPVSERHIVRGTATELDAADLRPGLTIAAADGVIRSAW